MSTCPICNTDIPNASKFCLECGYSFTGGQTGQLNPDTMLENRYIIVKTLGQGGMGAVYLALDTRLNNKPVAIKEMSTNAVGIGNLQAAIGAFKKEASMLINVQHSSLPRILDFFSKGEDRWYLVMDYIEGQTLKQVSDQRGRIPEAEALNWARQLCEILSYLHNQKPPIIFRDLKPTNIMLTPDGTIKLVDFGIARHFRPGLAVDTTAYGSAGFAPPEQYGKNQTDERSDIYALGATLYFLLTGIDPHENPFHYELLSKIINISSQFEAAIMQCLELKPQNRPGSVQELLVLLPPEEIKALEKTELSSSATIGGPTADLLPIIDETSTIRLKPETTNQTGDQDKISLNVDEINLRKTKQNQPGVQKTEKPKGKGKKMLLAAGLIICLLAGSTYGVNHMKGNRAQPGVVDQGTMTGSPIGANSQTPAAQAGLVPDAASSTNGNATASGAVVNTSSVPASTTNPSLSQTRYDLVPIQVGGLWGYQDKASGQMIVQPQFTEAQGFSEGLAVVKSGDNFGYINEQGNIAIAVQFYFADRFSEGLACAAMYPFTRGYIDKNANWVIYPHDDWDFGTPFQNGQAIMNGHTRIDRTGKVVYDELP